MDLSLTTLILALTSPKCMVSNNMDHYLLFVNVIRKMCVFVCVCVQVGMGLVKLISFHSVGLSDQVRFIYSSCGI